MRNYVRNWYLDVAGDSSADFDTFGRNLRVFVNFMHCCADSMGTNPSDGLVIVGEILGGRQISVSGISLITKVAVKNGECGPDGRVSGGIGAAEPYAYEALTSTGDTYLLRTADMDVSFRKEFIAPGGKIVHFNSAIAL